MTQLLSSEETSADRDLQYRVALFVQQRQLTANARVKVQARRGVVTLRGTVPTFHRRQLLYAFARRVAGVVNVVDELDVAELPRTRFSDCHRALSVVGEC